MLEIAGQARYEGVKPAMKGSNLAMRVKDVRIVV